jgi:hypothetical protein
MPIDLNQLPHPGGESLPDLNEEPEHEEQQEDHVHLQVHIQGGQPLPDLNEGPAHEQEEEDQVYLQVHLKGQPLPDLNEEPRHDHEEIDHLHEGQSQHLAEDEQVGVHAIDLNVDASMGEQQPQEGDLFLLIAYVQQQEHPHYDFSIQNKNQTRLILPPTSLHHCSTWFPRRA